MRLLLLRHGIAVEPGSPGYEEDSERPLTAKGDRRMRRVAEGMLTLGLSCDVILTSPYTRARQTADIVARALKCTHGCHPSADLAPDGDVGQLIGQLRADEHSRQGIMLVGHEPSLSRLLSTLLSGRPTLPVMLKKGGLCVLDVETLRLGRCARLLCLLTPRQLRALA